MSLYIEFIITQISKIIQSGESFGSWLANVDKKALKNVAMTLAGDSLPGKVSNLTSNAINTFKRKIKRKGAVRAGKGDSGVLIDEVTETAKYKIKKQECGSLPALLASLAHSLVQPVASSVLKGISGGGFRRAGKQYMDKKFLVPLQPLNNIEIINYFNYEPRFNGVFSRNNLTRI